jgi:hypothetical protein
MNLDLLETRANMLTTAGLYAWMLHPSNLPVESRDIKRTFLMRALDVLHTGLAGTRSQQRIKRFSKLIARIQDSLKRDTANVAYCLEQRAIRQEDNEDWVSRGYRAFKVIDSHVFSTQPFPFSYACSHARMIQDTLRKLGIDSITESPDMYYYRTMINYRGGTMQITGGHVVILVKADTAMDLELLRRRYVEYMAEYWYQSHLRQVMYTGDLKPFDGRWYKEHFGNW